jgi:hypothetical protein
MSYQDLITVNKAFSAQAFPPDRPTYTDTISSIAGPRRRSGRCESDLAGLPWSDRGASDNFGH